MSIADNIRSLKSETDKINVSLLAVSKTKPVEDILEAYNAGQRLFGENNVQDLVDKYETLPKDIEWHLIGHLQTNKVKYIAPFISMIESVDSIKLLQEINKHALKNDRVIDCLLQIYIECINVSFKLLSIGKTGHYIQSEDRLCPITLSRVMVVKLSNTIDKSTCEES
ncbi:MAG: YggS family pyridoxal phosphate-dependent enzyme [Flavobacterium sp.]|nr:MAG: YggS family pyridoxal phosphate-dependent enzyme [Flavobacterium sp.]